VRDAPPGESQRTKVEIALPVELIDDLDELASREGLDRSQMVTRLLAYALEELSVQAAVELYTRGEATAVAASEMCQMSTWEFLELVSRRG
jgi:metal-responsive CopG/Arc/MetJ family transcriptional regulator